MMKILKGVFVPLPFIDFMACFLIFPTLLGNTVGTVGIKSHEALVGLEEMNLSVDHNSNAHPSSSSFLRRIKRQEQSPENYDEEDQCRELPSRTHHSSSAPINLLELLNNGSHHMPEENGVKEAILILGNTGSGKTTLTQIIAGNLSSLHAVRTHSGKLVIVDDDNRIGTPSTISKTHIPELVLDKDGTAFYDCSGFDDTRGAEEDIAANFFINQIIRKVERVKLIFLVIHNSVTVGQERLDFDLMVSHATNFLRRFSNYNESIGLVVTKVDSFDDGGRFIKDKLIMKGIVQFLKIYLGDLRSQMQSISSGDEMSDLSLDNLGNTTDLKIVLERKIQFVESLLEMNVDGSYGKTSFSRGPTECGSLNNSKVVSDTKKRLMGLYSQNLKYAQVHPDDFGYTLKDKTKLVIINYVTSLNNDLTKVIATIMKEFKDWLAKEHLGGDLITIIAKWKRATAKLDGLLLACTDLGNGANPVALLEIAKSSFEELGYNISMKDQQLIQQQQRYFDFFDELNLLNTSRTVKDWYSPVKKLNEALKEDGAITKSELKKFVLSINQNISSEISLLMEGFMDWFNGRSQLKSNLTIKLEEIERSTFLFGKGISQLNLLGGQINPKDVMEIVDRTLETLGFDIPQNFRNNMKTFQDYFELDDEVNPPGISRPVKDWTAPVADLLENLKALGQRVQFSITIQKKEEDINNLTAELEVVTAHNKFLQQNVDLRESQIQELSSKVNHLEEATQNFTTKILKLMDESMEARNEADKLDRMLHNGNVSMENQTSHIEQFEEFFQRQTGDRDMEVLQEDLKMLRIATDNKRLQDENADLKRLITEKENQLAEFRAIYFRYPQANTRLHIAAARGNEQAITELLQLGADVNAKNINLETPIILAASSTMDSDASIRTVKYLIEHGADVFEADNEGQTFLHKLISAPKIITPYQFQDMVSYLVSKNLSTLFNVRDKGYGRTPLMLAAVNVDLEPDPLSLLFENKVDFTLVDKKGKNWLDFAENGHRYQKLLESLLDLENVKLKEAINAQDKRLGKLLVKLWASVSEKTHNLETPLHRASNSTDKVIAIRAAKFLIDSGANAHAQDKRNRTFLHILLENDTTSNPEQLEKQLLSNGTTLTSSEFINMVHYLVERNLSNLFNVRENDSGRTPLMLAASNVELDMATVSLLQTNGVDLTLVDGSGESYVSYAVDGNKNDRLLLDLNRNGSLKSLAEVIEDMDRGSVKLLLRLGVDVNAQNNNLETPLHLAAMSRNKEFAIEVIKLLIDSGAYVYIKDVDTHTFLHKLLDDATTINSAQFQDIVAFLVSKDMMRLFNIQNGHGTTPFQYAVKNVKIETPTLSLLKNYGVDFNAVDSAGGSVLYYAIKGNQTLKLVSDLVDLGANEKHLTTHKNSMLHESAKIGNVDLVQFFLDKRLDVSAHGYLGQTPLVYAVRFNKNTEVVQVLLKNGAKEVMMHAAWYTKDMRMNITFVNCRTHTAPRNCEDIQGTCNNASGIYTIFPFESRKGVAVEVYCDLVTDGGGWTVFQRRRPPTSATVDFERTWKEYAEGFQGSSMADSYWLGLNIISELTKAGDSTLRVDITDWDDAVRFAKYSLFKVENEAEKFKLTVSGYSGDAGDSLGSYHSGKYFTTRDRDNDEYSTNCAHLYRGAWWYGSGCGYSNLNGLYVKNGVQVERGPHVHWQSWHDFSYSLKTTEMKFRIKNFKGIAYCSGE